MKQFILICALLMALPVMAAHDNLLPKPQQATFGQKTFKLNRDIALRTAQDASDAPQVRQQLTQLVEDNGGKVAPNAKRYIAVRLTGSDMAAEAYRLQVSPDSIVITASSAQGAYWATQTLMQLADGNRKRIDECKITDAPAFNIRGFMHDVGRGFISYEELLREIDLLSRYKINVFHWHLADNQGWRLESRIYPQLNSDSAYSREPGKYYTIEQARSLVAYARQHGVTVIPEIDMPGHSEAFRKAMGHSMLTPEGLQEMKELMTEACRTLNGTPWMHIGTDEVRQPDLGSIDWTEFVPAMVDHLHSMGRKVASWAPGYNYGSGDIDLQMMWSSNGRPTEGIPATDSRYHYANHFDSYADIISLYSCRIADCAKGNEQYAGTVICFWNDRALPTEADIVRQNSLYPAMLAIAERAWLGGGKGYFSDLGVKTGADDADFADWERRFIYHQHHHLAGQPIFYVSQQGIKWHITAPVDNGGDLSRDFDLDSLAVAYEHTGAAVYLRHTWGELVPALLDDPQPNSTVYAFTDVISDRDQEVGLIFETQNYSRSESDLPPAQGTWDNRHSAISINGETIAPPVWLNDHSDANNEITLKNENASARQPIAVKLHKGTNRILIKLPVGKFRTRPQVRLVKWMFTCQLTTLDGTAPASGIIYK